MDYNEDISPEIIEQMSGSHLAVIKQSTGSHKAVIGQSVDIERVWIAGYADHIPKGGRWYISKIWLKIGYFVIFFSL